ncbi:MAG: hypothetical protein M3042_10200 [Actinomycetota bacterium]|nr:hypothetical protein [Actinomycetota bacterium]
MTRSPAHSPAGVKAASGAAPARRRRSTAERAQEALAVAQRRLTRAQDRRGALARELYGVEKEMSLARDDVDYLAKSPHLRKVSAPRVDQTTPTETEQVPA